MPFRLLLWTLPILLAACADAPAEAPFSHELHPVSMEETDRIQGVTLDARRKPPASTLPELAALGVTHVSVVPFAFQRRNDDPELRTNYDADWYTEGQAGIRTLAWQADSLGMDLILKPQIWIRGGSSLDIDFETEADWQQWETAYREFALFYARLSEEIEAPLFVIGAELGKAGTTREAFWRSLIAEIRTVYAGEVTYAANWYEDFEYIPFWDALDVVAIQAYFPLAETPAPTVEELCAGWDQHKLAIEAVHERTGKPVVFTEIGYRDVPHAAARPWEWPPHRERVAETDEDLQARLYTAFFEEVWTEPWMAGAIVWKWYPPSNRSHAGDFTPQGKPAEAVIRQMFGAGTATGAP